MFVELSPTIFPFALIFPETVNELNVPSEVTLGCAAVIRVPENEVAVNTPTPKILLLLPFKLPPKVGVVSPRIEVVIPVSEVNG